MEVENVDSSQTAPSNIIFIDASNIGGSGGAITHLREFLHHADFSKFFVQKVVVACKRETFEKVKNNREVIHFQGHSLLEGGYVKRLIWKLFYMPKKVKRLNALLFIPGTDRPLFKYPYVTMFRNLLPIDKFEMNRFKYSKTWLRYRILRQMYFTTFKKATGLICMNEYICNCIPTKVRSEINDIAIIPHGLSDIFKKAPKTNYSIGKEVKILYVSRINYYKHQWSVAEAVLKLREQGQNVKLQLVGSQRGFGRELLNSTIESHKEYASCIELIEEVDQSELIKYYQSADIFVFASTCETFGMILLEAMGIGLPIICSEKSSLPGLLKNNGLYFHPENVSSLINSLKKLIDSDILRTELGMGAHKEAISYSWDKTANATLRYITEKLEGIHNGLQN